MELANVLYYVGHWNSFLTKIPNESLIHIDVDVKRFTDWVSLLDLQFAQSVDECL